MKEKTACFTGHREIKGDIAHLEEKLALILEQQIQQGYCYFGAGGARGFDALAARTVLRLKEKYPHIHLILVLPFSNQYKHESGWSDVEIEEYHFLKGKASKVVHLQEKYSSGCYYRRNKHLVNHSSLCICYQYKNSGGTAYTTNYAKQQSLEIINCYTP